MICTEEEEVSDGRGTPKNHLDEVRMKKGMSKLNDIEKKFDKKKLYEEDPNRAFVIQEAKGFLGDVVQ